MKLDRKFCLELQTALLELGIDNVELNIRCKDGKEYGYKLDISVDAASGKCTDSVTLTCAGLVLSSSKVFVPAIHFTWNSFLEAHILSSEQFIHYFFQMGPIPKIKRMIEKRNKIS